MTFAEKHDCLVYVGGFPYPETRYSNIKCALRTGRERRHWASSERRWKQPVEVMVVTPQETFLNEEIDAELHRLCQ